VIPQVVGTSVRVRYLHANMSAVYVKANLILTMTAASDSGSVTSRTAVGIGYEVD